MTNVSVKDLQRVALDVFESANMRSLLDKKIVTLLHDELQHEGLAARAPSKLNANTASKTAATK